MNVLRSTADGTAPLVKAVRPGPMNAPTNPALWTMLVADVTSSSPKHRDGYNRLNGSAVQRGAFERGLARLDEGRRKAG